MSVTAKSLAYSGSWRLMEQLYVDGFSRSTLKRRRGGRGCCNPKVSDFRYCICYGFNENFWNLHYQYCIHVTEKNIKNVFFFRIFGPHPAPETRFKVVIRWCWHFFNTEVRDRWAPDALNSTFNNSICLIKGNTWIFRQNFSSISSTRNEAGTEKTWFKHFKISTRRLNSGITHWSGNKIMQDQSFHRTYEWKTL